MYKCRLVYGYKTAKKHKNILDQLSKLSKAEENTQVSAGNGSRLLH